MKKTVSKKETVQENNLAPAIVGNSFKMTNKGIESFDPDVTYEECQSAINYFGHLRENSKWIIGDILNFAEAKYGEKYSQIMNDTQLDYKTLSNYCWVAKAFEFPRRRDISFTHHMEVAKLDPEYRDELLQTAIDEKLSVQDLRILANPPKEKEESEPKPRAKKGLNDETKLKEIKDPEQNSEAQNAIAKAIVYLQSSDFESWPDIQKDQWIALQEKFTASLTFAVEKF